MGERKIYPELGLYIYNLISKSAITKEDIAEKLDVDVRTIEYYCSGQRRPEQTKLLKLLKITKANILEIPF